jgi:hypothetical protein
VKIPYEKRVAIYPAPSFALGVARRSVKRKRGIGRLTQSETLPFPKVARTESMPKREPSLGGLGETPHEPAKVCAVNKMSEKHCWRNVESFA